MPSAQIATKRSSSPNSVIGPARTQRIDEMAVNPPGMLRCGVVVLLLLMAMTSESNRASARAEENPHDLTEMSLENLMNIEVYSASKYLQSSAEAPASVTIITSDDIRKYGFQSLAEILQSVRGFYVTYDRNYSYAGIRGFGRTGDYNTRVLLLIDGHRLNDDVYDEALLGTEFPLDVDLIDRVEVIRGPSSSLYGSNAYFGVVNVITRRARDVGGAEASTDLGSFGTYKGRLTYGHRFKKGLSAVLSTSFYRSQGQRRLFFSEFDNPATNNGIAENADGDRFGQVFGSAAYRGFTLQGVYGSRRKQIPTASFGTVFDDPRTRTSDQEGYLDLQYDHTFRREIVFSGRLYYDQMGYDGHYVYNYSQTSTPNIVVNNDFASGKRWGEDLKLTKQLLEKHKVVLGSEYRDNFEQGQGNFDFDPFTQYLDDRRSSNIWAAYGQDEFTVRNGLMLYFGARYDYYSTYGGSASPRLGAIYSPLQKTTFKVLYGRAFRAPNAYELYYQAAGQVGNRALRPEEIRTAEVVFEQHVRNHSLITADIFENRISRLIGQRPVASGALQFQNISAARARGAEVELESQWASGFKVQVAYTFQYAINLQTGSNFYNSAEHLGKLNCVLPLVGRKLFAGMDLQYVSKRTTLAGGVARGYVVPNFTLFSQRVLKGFSVSATLYNAFDTEYGYPGGYEHVESVINQNGRNARLKFTYVF